MDLLTLFGITLSIVAIVGGQYIDGGNLNILLNLPAFLIVFGGTLGAVIFQTRWGHLKHAFRLLRWLIFPPKIPFEHCISSFVLWSRISRKEGFLALESFIEKEKNQFLKKGLTLLISGLDAISLKRSLELHMESEIQEKLRSAEVFESMGGYSPTIGIIGAVLGLIHAMKTLSEPALLGHGIAIAFVSTVYGIGLANLIFLPIANRLKQTISKQVQFNEMLIEGLVSISNAQNPTLIEAKLKGFTACDRLSTSF